MKDILISRNKVRNYLADQLTQKVLQMNESTLYSMIRYEGIGGFNKISDTDMFVMLVESLPEFRLLRLVRADNDNIITQIKEEYADTEDDILVDISRILQTKLI
jgi:hypothetical protein